VRYLFRGLIRETGGPVEGHVEAPTEEAAYDVLADTGVVTESLIPDPKPLNLNEELPASPEFADALESAFDSSSSQIDFDALAQRYTGKKVWVIDRDKIRRRVAQVVDAALALAQQHGEEHGKVRERVQTALTAMFADNRNLATERNAESIAGMRLGAGDSVAGFRLNTPGGPTVGASPVRPVSFTNIGAGPAAPAPPVPGGGHAGLESQIVRLANLVKQAEATLTTIAAAARRVGSGDGGGGPRRRSIQPSGRGQEQNAVLLEIFKSNLELVRSMQDPATAAALAAADAAAAGAAAPPAEPAPGMLGSAHTELETGDTVGGEPGEAVPASEDLAEPLGAGEPGEAASSDANAGDNAPEPLRGGDSTPGAEEIPEHLGKP
jgi:hypothetical protein